MKRNADLLTILSFPILGMFAVNTWIMSDQTGRDIWLCFGIPFFLLSFELFGIYDTYKKRRDTLPKVFRFEGIVNMTLFVVSCLMIGFTR